MQTQASRQAPPPDGELKLIQITDSHLFAREDEKLVGMNCQEGFDAVLEMVHERHPRPDCILCTGDLVQDASVAGYRRFHDRVAGLQAPQLWTPGNHDENAGMLTALGKGSACFLKSLTFGNWQIVMLDTHVEGKIYGWVQPEELARLDALLTESGCMGRHVLICCHHNPVPVNAAWLQRHCLKNADALFSCLDRHEHVRGLVFGHVHQEISTERQGVRIMSSPSTCIQFHPDSDLFALDDLNPGYRWFRLGTDGSIATGVERVEGRRFEVDFSSTGY